METLDTLRAERDAARSESELWRRSCIAILIDDCVDASRVCDIHRLISRTEALATCPDDEAQRCVDIGLSVGNFLAGCAFVEHVGPKKKTDEGEVLFDATKKAVA